MKITMTQDDLESAVGQYLSGMGISAPVNAIQFSATRGEAGFIAHVEVGEIRETTMPAKDNVVDLKSEDVQEEPAPEAEDSEPEQELEELVEGDEEEVTHTGKSLFA